MTLPPSRTPRPPRRRAGPLAAACCAVLSLAILSLAAPARAADLATAPAPAATAFSPPPESKWQFSAVLYGWATGINGNLGIRDLPTFPVDASFADILSHFDGAVMGSFLAKKDNWTLFADLFWSQLSASKSIDDGRGTQLDLSQRLLIVSGAAGYRLPIGGPGFDLSATAGFRYQRLTADTTLSSFGGILSVSETDVKDWLDPVFGLALQYRINEKWFLNALADVGGFGLPSSSKLTSQGLISVGYNWTEAWSTAIGYRALYTDYESVTGPRANFRYETTLHGPFMSIAYHF
ncbi:hypothetical protein Xaut_2419 [Xanthobacter versatilis]|uniref:Outer membrane protein beta-barrel domain-containing protein n=1 Tax=Xanthobacter autotrophicus (strain ATCC BAA-1158 / Py2) TaxID=78245 RepID=A7II18_XANP2|nr:hypothetical protein Xaut_2419 [Xanthobacter autotrophicus Py2]